MNELLLEIEPTPNCNADCTFCRPVVPKARRNTYLDYKLFAQIMAEFGEMQIATKYIIFAGLGEPALHPFIDEMVMEARMRNPTAIIQFYTNGILLATNELATELFMTMAPYVNTFIYDNYNDDIGRKMIYNLKAVNFPLDKVRCLDHAGGAYSFYNDRAGRPELATWKRGQLSSPCQYFQNRIFLSAEGYFILCCQDTHHQYKWGSSLKEMFGSEEYKRVAQALSHSRTQIEPCSKCGVEMGLVGETPPLPERLF